MDKPRFSLLLVAIFTVIGALSVFYFRDQKTEALTSKAANSPVPVQQTHDTISTPTPTETRVLAPGGKMTLVMREEKNKNGVTYTFSTIDEKDQKEKQIFTKTLPTGESIIIPFNTWSPTDKYLLLKETTTHGDSYFVISALGLPLAKEVYEYNVTELFTEKYQNFVITEMTGWAGPTLVVINTDKLEGGIGPSFWFEVPYKGFIRLSTRFN